MEREICAEINIGEPPMAAYLDVSSGSMSTIQYTEMV